MKGAKTQDGKDVRAKMWDFFNDCVPGTILALVKSGVNIPEFVSFQRANNEDMSSKRGLAVELHDALVGEKGMNIGERLLDLGLVEEEVREEKYDEERVPYYVVRKDTGHLEPSAKLKLLRQHEAYLASRLEQFQIRDRTEENPEDSARFGKIKERIEDFQSKLEEIKERREKTEDEEIV